MTRKEKSSKITITLRFTPSGICDEKEYAKYVQLFRLECFHAGMAGMA